MRLEWLYCILDFAYRACPVVSKKYSAQEKHELYKRCFNLVHVNITHDIRKTLWLKEELLKYMIKNNINDISNAIKGSNQTMVFYETMF